jgi:hypothetical protein
MDLKHLRDKVMGREAAPVRPQLSEEEYRAQERARLDALPHGPGLKQYEVDPHLYRPYSIDSRMLYSRAPRFMDTVDPLIKSEMARRGVDMTTGESLLMQAFLAGMSGNSKELESFLDQTEPQPTYFTPEMIAERLPDMPGVRLEQGNEDGVDCWRFSTVIPDGDEQSMTLSRAGRNPRKSVDPYMRILWWTEADPADGHIIFKPELETALQPLGEPRDFLYDQILAGLGVETIHRPERIEAKVVDQRFNYMVPGVQTEGFDVTHTSVPCVIVDFAGEAA